MSRRLRRIHNGILVVGWDSPIGTYFFQLWTNEDWKNDDAPWHDDGWQPGEIMNVGDLESRIREALSKPDNPHYLQDQEEFVFYDGERRDLVQDKNTEGVMMRPAKLQRILDSLSDAIFEKEGQNEESNDHRRAGGNQAGTEENQ